MDKKLEKAVNVVREGGIIIFPTDTAFGIGCRIDNESSVERLFTIRQRSLTKATPVLCSSVLMVEEYVEIIPKSVKEDLIPRYWPGAVTIVLKAKTEKVPSLVRGGGETVGMRIPNHKIPLQIIDAIRVPIIGTSANLSGHPTPYNISDLDPELVKAVDFVVEGECTLKKESTVIDATVEPWKILRQGAVNIE